MTEIPNHDSLLDDLLRRDEAEEQRRTFEDEMRLEALEEEMAEDDGGDW
jgi:hypothetical protein